MHCFEEGAVQAVCIDKALHDITVWHTGGQIPQPDILPSATTKLERGVVCNLLSIFPTCLFISGLKQFLSWVNAAENQNFFIFSPRRL
jgi:hypothetical protein